MLHMDCPLLQILDTRSLPAPVLEGARYKYETPHGPGDLRPSFGHLPVGGLLGDWTPAA